MAEAPRRAVVIGGGAAGFFGAIRAAEAHPSLAVTLLEAGRRTLAKVRISGGGRCNVTHHCFEPAELVRSYPRGADELRGPFSRFQPRDTVAWFAARGVELKVEADGRMFPVTDDSATIAGCLERAAQKAGVALRLGAAVTGVKMGEAGSGAPRFTLSLKDGGTLAADRMLVATGSAPAGYELVQQCGHRLQRRVPSLFTFKIQDPRFAELAGVSVPRVQLQLAVGDSRLKREGPLLVTHWGLSGPAVLKLSAFGAIPLFDSGYTGELTIDYVPGANAETALRTYKEQHPKQTVAANGPFPELPRRLWQRLVQAAGIDDGLTYASLPRAAHLKLAAELNAGVYAVRGKGVFKEEFVTAGGVALADVDFRTLESRRCPGVHFAGEILDIDGITGGFNFQAAWTTAWIAGEALGRP